MLHSKAEEFKTGSLGKAGRLEDDALIRGAGRYTDDTKPDRVAAVVFVRSPHALANIRGVDTSAAVVAPGVIAVFTAADFEAANLATVTQSIPLPGKDGSRPISPFRPVLARDRAVHIGQAVALVVAESVAEAQDAADLVVVDYESLEPVIDLAQAADGAVEIWPEAPGNLAFEWSAPTDPDGSKRREAESIFASAAHVAKIDIINQRISVVSMEPRGASASFDAETGRFTLRCGTQGVAGIRAQLAACLQLKPESLRVITDDVGGGFGMKAGLYPEYPALLLAAQKLGRPVHWLSTRAEAFLSDNQARDITSQVELALNAEGRFLALRVTNQANIGAFIAGVSLLCSTLHIANCLPSIYDIPHILVDTRCYFTNTLPTAPYRGAGRPEANYLLERVIEVAARQLCIDAAELRRRNLIAGDRIPYKTATGQTYDSGDFPGIFEKAVAAADYAGFPARQAAAARRGQLRGIGIGCFLEIAGGFLEEPARVSFAGNGKLQVSLGMSSSGQGHVTVFTDLVAGRLDIPAASIEIQFGDSARDVPGFGAVASRSAMLVGGAIAVTLDRMLEKARELAALLLQARPDELAYREGAFVVAGSERRLSLFDIAERAPELLRQGVASATLDTQERVTTGPSFPNGCHIAEVEVDPETGGVTVVGYVAVDDCGNVLNTTIATAQIHGGVAQGLGQALEEHTIYEQSSGQLLSGSFMDYCIPRATSLPAMTTINHPVACTTNPLGTKGAGEAGTTAAPSAIVNAVEHAISPKRSLSLDMPLTPLKVWRAIQSVSAELNEDPSEEGTANGSSSIRMAHLSE